MNFIKSIIFTFVFSLFALSAAADENCPDGHGTLRQDANLRGGPGTSFKVLTPLLKGTRVAILSKQQDWLNLRVLDLGKSGWIHSDLVKKEPCNPALTTAFIKSPTAKKLVKSEKKLKQPVQQISPHQTDQTAQINTGERSSMYIGVIDIQQVIIESRNGIAARQKYEELKRTSEQTDIEQMEMDIINSVIIEIQSVVESYAKKHGFSHILNKNSGSIFYNDSMYDITSEIIKEYDRQVAMP